MSDPSSEGHHLPFSRIALVGLILILVGVGLFLAIYFFLHDIAEFPRIVISICAPPMMIAGISGIYMLLTRKSSTNERHDL